ncbi:MAG: YigZ family protein, partial [Oscillospiraceae bacterium]|nr:YigZ family protein [Oscillospiraceae bacterium]
KTSQEALDFIAKIKSKHYDATHNVSAYIIKDENVKRYSDDGEPQGTAGIPSLDVLEKQGLVDVCVVVTRYFGGIMLGAGGLVRAYSHGAKIAIDAAKVVTMADCIRFSLTLDYNLYGKINYIIPDYNIRTENSEFTDSITLTLLILKERFDAFKKQVCEITNGSIEPVIIEEVFDMMD